MTKKDFLAFLDENNIGKDTVLFDNNVNDGYCIRKVYFRWEVCFRERGKEFWCVGFPSEDDALEFLAKKILRYRNN